MECSRCGKRLGSMEYHPTEVCARQQETNRKNLNLQCNWCKADGTQDHKEGCPKKAAGK